MYVTAQGSSICFSAERCTGYPPISHILGTAKNVKHTQNFKKSMITYFL